MTTRELAAFICENKERSRQIRRTVYEEGVFGEEWSNAFNFERDCYKAMLALNRIYHRFNIAEC